jgi:two-component system, LytTR family, response regulator
MIQADQMVTARVPLEVAAPVNPESSDKVSVTRPGQPPRLVIKTGSRILFLRPEQIEWIEAERNWVRLHLGRDNQLVRDTMYNFERRLDPNQFLRVHRSAIVNLDHVKEMVPLPSGDYRVTLRSGVQLLLSRTYRPRLSQLLRERE